MILTVYKHPQSKVKSALNPNGTDGPKGSGICQCGFRNLQQQNFKSLQKFFSLRSKSPLRVSRDNNTL